MNYRTLGNSSLELPVITFGAWAAGGWMWGTTIRNEAINAIKAAYDVGVTAIDTAPIYGQGESEEIVGDAIKGISREKVQILTKCGMIWQEKKGDFMNHSVMNDGTPIDVYKYAGKESIIWECEQSLKRLNTDYIDLYQVHWPENVTPIAEIMEAFIRLQEQGKIKYFGVCNYNKSQAEEAFISSRHLLTSNQIPFSMVNRKTEAETIPYCKENNLGILAYSPLERGLLTGKITVDYKFAEGDHRNSHPAYSLENRVKVTDFLKHLVPVAKAHNCTLGQLVLAWTIQHPGITIALVGARNATQAKENAYAAEIVLNKAEVEMINAFVYNY